MTLGTFLLDMLGGAVICECVLLVAWCAFTEHRDRHWGRCLILDDATFHYVEKIQRENERRRQLDALTEPSKLRPFEYVEIVDRKPVLKVRSRAFVRATLGLGGLSR